MAFSNHKIDQFNPFKYNLKGVLYMKEITMSEVNIPVNEDTLIGQITYTQIENIRVDHIIAVLSGALGYSHYWCDSIGIEETEGAKDLSLDESETMTVEMRYCLALLNGHKLKVITDEGEEYTADLSDFVKAFKLNREERAWDADIFEGDAITADCIFQYAFFGEIIYG